MQRESLSSAAATCPLAGGLHDTVLCKEGLPQTALGSDMNNHLLFVEHVDNCKWVIANNFYFYWVSTVFSSAFHILN